MTTMFGVGGSEQDAGSEEQDGGECFVCHGLYGLAGGLVEFGDLIYLPVPAAARLTIPVSGP